MITLVLVSIETATLALPAPDVVEVVRAVAITSVPGCPDAIEGVVNVRGEPLPVYDLRRRFALSPRPVHPDEHFLIVTAGTRGRAIIRVSRVQELRTIEDDALTSAERSSDPMVRGLARFPDGLLVVCDLAAFLTDLDAARVVTALAEYGPRA